METEGAEDGKEGAVEAFEGVGEEGLGFSARVRVGVCAEEAECAAFFESARAVILRNFAEREKEG